jgi:prepilin-type N-terminal cleavage/methylation domain-containing protein
MVGKSGFTLIELLIALSLCTIICSLSITSFSWLDKNQISYEIEQLASACHYMRQVAMATQQPTTISFNVQRNQYTYDGRTISLPSAIRFGAAPGVKGPPSSPHTPIQDGITFKNNAVECCPQGIIQAGTIYMYDTKHGTTYALSSSVAHVSYLRKYRYDEKWQMID